MFPIESISTQTPQAAGPESVEYAPIHPGMTEDEYRAASRFMIARVIREDRQILEELADK